MARPCSRAAGKLRISRKKQEAEWLQNGARRKLTYLDPPSNRQLIYTKLGADKGEQYGTPCDWAQ